MRYTDEIKNQPETSLMRSPPLHWASTHSLLVTLVLIFVLVCGCITFNVNWPGSEKTPTITERTTEKVTETTMTTLKPLTNQPTSILTSVKTGTGTVYHVAVSGNDANPGTESQPWSSFQHAVDMVSPGDTIQIHRGEYSENLQITMSGQDGRFITLMAAPGETVTLHGEIGLRKGVSYYLVQGINMDSYNPWGLTLWGDNHHIGISQMQMTGRGCRHPDDVRRIGETSGRRAG